MVIFITLQLWHNVTEEREGDLNRILQEMDRILESTYNIKISTKKTKVIVMFQKYRQDNPFNTGRRKVEMSERVFLLSSTITEGVEQKQQKDFSSKEILSL